MTSDWRRSFVWALLTGGVGFAVGLNGFLTFAARMADSQTSWVARELARPDLPVNPLNVVLVPYGTSVFTYFGFLFLTPVGLFSLYLLVSGAVRAISAWFDDPRGDFILTGVALAVTSAATAVKRRQRRASREKLEGPDRPDVVRSGALYGVDADYVVLAARRKPEWDAGTAVMTSTDCFRLGTPFDIDTPAGVRTAYPLKKMGVAEVIRRGVQYELPEKKNPAGPRFLDS